MDDRWPESGWGRIICACISLGALIAFVLWIVDTPTPIADRQYEGCSEVWGDVLPDRCRAPFGRP